MKFQLALNLERMDDSVEIRTVRDHTLEMVQIAERGGFDIVWAAEHHALEMTIAPNPFQILTWSTRNPASPAPISVSCKMKLAIARNTWPRLSVPSKR